MKSNKTLDLNGVKIPLQLTVVYGGAGTGKSTLLQLLKYQLQQNHIDVVYLKGLERIDGLLVADGDDLKNKIANEFKSRSFRDYKESKVIIIDHIDHLLSHDFDFKVIDALLSDDAVEYGVIGIVASQTLLHSELFSKIGVSLNGNQIKMLNNYDGDYTAEIKTFVKLGWTRKVINRPVLNNY